MENNKEWSIDGIKFLEEITKSAQSLLLKSIEDAFINGLKMKGYIFENRNDLLEFIASNCRCEERPFDKTKTYFVNEIPFLIHYNYQNFDFNKKPNENDVVFEATLGYCSYL